MSQQNLPVTATASPVVPGTTPADINALMLLICQTLSFSLAADASASLFASGTSIPTSDVGPFYNTLNGKWYNWNQTLGAYQRNTDWNVGDEKQTYNAGDDLVDGWVEQDGRTIAAIPGLTNNQLNALLGLFPGGVLPNKTYAAVYSDVFVGFPQ